ncbi:carboxypeptidase-like regulatory domain-containing protein [Deinococcus gobiensis]|uniref:PEGA domain-containing protein n=1 Tax=Deinococcus gobiensis (strain DSM 21396 / JCM 16679 / CGMCC 1.7299 / I-0) TaxID=745776 RepID=H8GZB2_DEIGI|nr:carboxypeptidase-like regulatory domain-containing protein [Deinococcus gobiensis]AFD24960.1 hypothetical protein DGo_CA1033 [Deinococcus gobiensis I-0]
MKSIGPYVMARASSGDGAAPVPPGGAARPLWATDRLTGIPVLLQPLGAPLDALPALPDHPALLPPSDLLSLPGEGEFLVTELPLQAVPASDARLAARGALQALDALHRRGQTHGQVSAAHLWSVDGQVRLSGAGLPTTATSADDLRDLAHALGDLGGLPAGLEVLRAAPDSLSAGEALRRLSWGASGAAVPAHAPESPAAPVAVAPSVVVPPAVVPGPADREEASPQPIPAGSAPALPQVFDLGPAAQPVLPPPAGPREETAAPVPAQSVSAPPAKRGPKRGAGAQARQRLRADAARAERQLAAGKQAAATEVVGSVPQASAPDTPDLTGDGVAAPSPAAATPLPQDLTPQERRRRMRVAAEAEAEARAAAPPLTPPARPASAPEPERLTSAPRRELRPMRLRWSEGRGAETGGWQRRRAEADPGPAEAGPANPGSPGTGLGRPDLGAALTRWRWPVLAALLLVLLLGAVWAWGQGRGPQAGAGADCCTVRFELSGAAPASGVRLTLAQAPAGAGVRSGASLGTVPGTVRLPSAGTYRVRVAAEGFTPETVSVTVPVSAPVRIELGR